MMQDHYTNTQLVSADLFRLDQILSKMVSTGSISLEEKEELLHKAGLLKQEDGRWLELSSGAILTFAQ